MRPNLETDRVEEELEFLAAALAVTLGIAALILLVGAGAAGALLG